MSDNNNNNNSGSTKPRVYQGVRVKTTVKELLQRHRAREANSKKLKTIAQACLELQDLCQSTFTNILPPGRYADPAPLPLTSPQPGSCAPQMRAAAFQAPPQNPHCGLQMQADAFSEGQFAGMTTPFPGNGYSDGGYCAGAAAPLTPPHGLPLNWYYGLSSDADYYGHGMMVPPDSPPEPPHSYSPQDSFSSSSSSSSSSSPPSCYDSPPCLATSDPYPYQHCDPPQQDSYCLSHCWTGQQQQPESYPTPPEALPAYYPADYPAYTCLLEEGFHRVTPPQMGPPEMCYNVL